MEGTRRLKYGLGRVGRKLADCLLSQQPREVVAVALGGTSVRVAHIVFRRDETRFVATAERRLAVRDQLRGRAYWDRVGASLREMASELSLSGKPCWACMPDHLVQFKQISLPRMPGAETRRALELEWKKTSAAQAGGGIVDYEPAGAGVASAKTGFLIAAADAENVRACLSVLESAGLVVQRVSTLALAYRSLIRALGTGDADGVKVILNVGGSGSHICVFKNRELILARELSVGGKNLSEALTRIVTAGGPDLVFEFEEAEEIKRKFGVPLSGEQKTDNPGSEPEGNVLEERTHVERELAVAESAPGAAAAATGEAWTAEGAGELSGENVLVMMRPVLERLLREIWSSIEYSSEELMGNLVDRIYLSGGGARLRGLCEYVSSVLKIEVRPIASLVGGLGPRVRSDKDVPWELYSLCLGLSLNGYQGIDLSRVTRIDRVRKTLGRVRLAPIAAVALALMLGTSVIAYQHGKTWAANLAREKQELEQLSGVQQKVREFGESLAMQETMRSSMQQVTGPVVQWSKVMMDVSARVGGDVQLTGMAVEIPNVPGSTETPSPRLVLTGYMRISQRRLEEVLGELMLSLSGSPFLADVRLVRSEAADGRLAGFSLTCGLVAGSFN
ncbi:MAG: pilus assembly protein PilM [Candidatus Eisenbacteria bacterium]